VSIDNIPDESANRPKNQGEAEAKGVVISPWETNDQAEGELRWLFCQSGGDLGEHSAWSSLVQMAQAGGHSGTRLEPYVDGEVTAPLPTKGQVWAAARQSRYRDALRKLPKQNQAVLERQLSNGRPNRQIRGLLGQHHAEKLEPTVTYMLERGEIHIKTDGTDKELPGIIERAEAFYEASLNLYRAARGIKVRNAERRERRETRAPSPVISSRPALTPVEAPRKSRP
jgi:hypothetical protein